MFSIEKPLEPLSSSSSPNSQSQLVVSEQETRSDERNSDSDKVFDSQKQHDNAIDLLVDSPPTPNFSIRDYAYKSRSKSIETNWPFKPKFLTLCLKNGIKQPLPPFEPPDLIKTRPVNTFQPDPLLSSSHVLIPNSISDENTLSDTENLPLVAIKDKKKKNKALEKVKKVKKCNILVTGSNQNREKEIGSNNNSVTDPMASKICPVCKTFSSSSNTTLNAHIDQCLSMDSDSKRVENDVSKPKIKPKKKKLLTEIYETALCYTLEDLDRRNGTNWALNGVTGPNVEKGKPVKESSDEERESCRGEEREGAVYVDSNGIKIRILSKFDDLKEEGAMVLKEEKKKEKGKFGNKKFKGVEMKNMKKKNNLESKKLKPFKGLKTRVQPPREGKINETQNKNSNEITSEEVFEFNVQNETEKSKNQNNIIIPLSNWVCAKRSDTPKKRNKKNPYKITHNLLDNNSLSPSTSQQIPKFSNSKSSNPSLNTPLRFKFPKPNRDLSTESVNLQNSPSKSFKKQRSVLKHSKKSSVSTRVLHEEENHFEDSTSRANKRLKFSQCNLADPNEITQNYRDQNENTQLDIIEPSLPAINENFEHINEPHENEDPLMSPQTDNNINDDVNDVVMDDDVDDDVIEREENYNTSLDTPQEDSSITSNWDEEFNLDSESPNSTFSTTSLSSKEPVTTPSDSLTNDPLTPTDSEITERGKKVEEIADKPFACSCRENLSKEKQLLPPLYIGPRETVPYQRPENLIGTGFDSPSPSFSTLSQGPVPVSVPIPASPSNPILRLMGKNLLVVNQEEIPSTPSSSVSRTGFMPPQNFAYQSQSMMMNNPYQPFHRNEMNRQVSVSPYMQKEVIVIDDSPEMNPVPVPVSVPMPQNISLLGSQMMQQSPFLYYPTQNHQMGLGPTGTMGTMGTTGTVMYPRVGTGYFTQMGPSGVHEPGPFIFRPPSGYLDPSLYYSHTMR